MKSPMDIYLSIRTAFNSKFETDSILRKRVSDFALHKDITGWIIPLPQLFLKLPRFIHDNLAIIGLAMA